MEVGLEEELAVEEAKKAVTLVVLVALRNALTLPAAAMDCHGLQPTWTTLRHDACVWFIQYLE